MSSPHFKPKLLLDENMPPRTKFPRTNERFDIKHIVADLHHSGISDQDVHKLACQEKRLIATFNYEDFQKIASNENSGIVGLSPNLSNEEIDKKLCALLIKNAKKNLYGKSRFISGETER